MTKPQQQSLFELEPAAWEEDDAREQQVATVVFSSGPQQPFDYSVPEHLRGHVTPGQRVRAPLGSQTRPLTGYCVRLENRQAGLRRLKSLAGVLDERALVSPSMLRLTEWMADYYLCGWGQVLETVVPAGVRGRAGTRMAQFVSLPNRVAARLATLKLPPKQLRIVNYLAAQSQPVAMGRLAVATECTEAPIRALARKGLVELHARRIDVGTARDEPQRAAEAHLTLSAEQQQALEAILAALHAGPTRRSWYTASPAAARPKSTCRRLPK